MVEALHGEVGDARQMVAITELRLLSAMAPSPSTLSSSGAVSPVTARKTWRTVEPLHGMIYFAPEANELYAALGIPPAAGYFASRSAPMGPVNRSEERRVGEEGRS